VAYPIQYRTSQDKRIRPDNFLLIQIKQRKKMWDEVLKAMVTKSTIFWDITPCSPLSTDVSEKHRLHFQGRKKTSPARNQQSSAFHLLLCSFLSRLTFPILKMEEICSAETPVDTQRTTRRYIPEDGTLQKNNRLNEFLVSSVNIIKLC
jgi:hypothetical protein